MDSIARFNEGRRTHISSGGNCSRRRAARASRKLNAIAAIAASPASPNVMGMKGNPAGGGGGGGGVPAATTRSSPTIPAFRSVASPPYHVEATVRFRTITNGAVFAGDIEIDPVLYGGPIANVWRTVPLFHTVALNV